jgi:predicted transcriptional regulator
MTGGSAMASVKLMISDRKQTRKRLAAAFAGKPQGNIISFTTPELLFKTLSGKRWDLLKMMTGAGPMSIREAARRLERDVKGVHTDVHALLKTGIIQRTAKGQIVFPYDSIHVEFVVEAA